MGKEEKGDSARAWTAIPPRRVRGRPGCLCARARVRYGVVPLSLLWRSQANGTETSARPRRATAAPSGPTRRRAAPDSTSAALRRARPPSRTSRHGAAATGSSQLGLTGGSARAGQRSRRACGGEGEDRGRRGAPRGRSHAERARPATRQPARGSPWFPTHTPPGQVGGSACPLYHGTDGLFLWVSTVTLVRARSSHCAALMAARKHAPPYAKRVAIARRPVCCDPTQGPRTATLDRPHFTRRCAGSTD